MNKSAFTGTFIFLRILLFSVKYVIISKNTEIHPKKMREKAMSELISNKFKNWEKICSERFYKLKENEEKLNSFFIELYGLSDELTPEVEERYVTVRKAELQREIKSLISYAVGCIFGRYSPDMDGLCYAGGEWVASAYSTILPCSDNIMTINSTDNGLFPALTDFYEKIYGSDTLEENLRFIAEAIDDGGDPRTVIYRYLRKGFFTDHVKIYKKRPIYWQITSGSQSGFKALMYLHRFNNSTLTILRKDHAVPYYEGLKKELSECTEKYSSSSGAEKAALRRDISRLKASLLEMEGFIHRLRELEDNNITLDLDDGVKVNYEKLSDILEKI